MHRKQEQLINTLYTKYARKIRDWAYRHTGNINIAEDIMQETFLILLIKIDEVIEHEDPRKWLFRRQSSAATYQCVTSCISGYEAAHS